MSSQKNKESIDSILERYPAEIMYHVFRVADLLYSDIEYHILSEEEQHYIYILAVLHDIIEDTNTTFDEVKLFLPESFLEALKLLTRVKNISYQDYITAIKKSNNRYAKIVKRCDLVDHFKQFWTLKDSLKERYIAAAKELLNV